MLRSILALFFISTLISCKEKPKKILNVVTSPVSSGEVSPISTPKEKPEEPKLIELFRYSTEFKNKPNRTNNILKSSKTIIILPNQTFSFNKFVGPRTSVYGFKPAPGYFMGEVVPSMGGGVCQVSSTLYAAATHVGLTIIERRPHSRKSSYISPGLDATVNYPKECWDDDSDKRFCFDLKIRNDYKFPITFEFSVLFKGEFNELIVDVYAVKDIGVKITSKWRLMSTPPSKVINRRRPWQKNDKRKRKQQGKPGMNGFRVYTYEYPNRVEKRRVFSSYKPVDEIWHVGADWENDSTDPN